MSRMTDLVTAYQRAVSDRAACEMRWMEALFDSSVDAEERRMRTRASLDALTRVTEAYAELLVAAWRCDDEHH